MIPSRSLALTAMVVILLSVDVAGQSAIGQQEDFDDDTLNGSPSGFYTYTESPSHSGMDVCNVDIGPESTGGLDGTSQAYCGIDPDAASPDPNVVFAFAAEQYETMSFWILNGDIGINSDFGFLLEDSSGFDIYQFSLFNQNNGSGSCNTSGGCFTSNGCVVGSDAFDPNGVYFFNLTFNWTAKNFVCYVEAMTGSDLGSFKQRTISFASSSATNLAKLTIAEDGEIDMKFDQWRLDGGPLAPDPTPTPSEFDSGLLVFITGLGFITHASQFFFAIIIIGITIVLNGVLLKFMAPGKMKLMIVASTAMLLGAFFAILDLYDLWAFTLAAVLGGVIVKGAGDFRSTFLELKKALAERVGKSTGEGDDEQAEAAMGGKQVIVEEVPENDGAIAPPDAIDDYVEPVGGFDSPSPTASEAGGDSTGPGPTSSDVSEV